MSRTKYTIALLGVACVALGAASTLPTFYWLTYSWVEMAFFFLAGWAVLLDRRWLPAGLLLGLAVGSRFTTLFAVIGVLVFAWGIAADDRRAVLRSSLIAVGVGAACYLPSAYEFGWTLGFLAPAGMGGPELWTWPLRLGRWGYKSIYFWGVPSALFLLL